jgi:F-type H+-transporting ATPase subunit b
MITIDITMVIQIINILVLIGVMNVVLYKPVRTMLAKRDEKLNTLQKEIETFHKNAKLRQEEIDRKLHEAHIKAKDELDGMRGTAQASAAEKLAKIREESAAAKTARVQEIQQQVTSARSELQAQIDGFATEIAGKIMGRAV